MEKTDPPSPAPSNSANNLSEAADDIFQSQFQQLIQHNASAPPIDVHNHISSNPHSRYSSPAPQPQLTMPVYDHGSPYAATAAPSTSSYSGYQQSYIEPSPYPQLPDTTSSLTPHNAYSTPATSPPTPIQNDAMTTRSGRTISSRAHRDTPVLGPQASRIEKSSPRPSRGAAGGGSRGAGAARKTKKRKGKGGAGDEPAVVLEAPLSELVKDVSNVTDTNIEEYVNRSPDVRQAEVRDSKEGKVKRPMNAFMLYRKAYQNRTKEWKKHDNHQVISQVCGTSWNMESQELRDQYDAWAKIERANHKLAFPDYKFAPAKAKNKKLVPGGAGADAGGRGSSRGGTGDSDDGSDLEGYEWDVSAPPSRNGSRLGRPSSIYDPDAEYRPPGVARPAYALHHQYAAHSPSPHPARLSYALHQQQPPPFQYAGVGPGSKPRPGEYSTGLGYYHHQQASGYPQHLPAYASSSSGMAPSHAPAFVEGIYMNKANSSPATSFHGSPVDHYGEMMGPGYGPPPPRPASHLHASLPPEPPHHHHHQIDPSLMTQSGASGIHDAYDALGIFGGASAVDQGSDYGGQHPHRHAAVAADTAFRAHDGSGVGLGAVATTDPWQDDPLAAAARIDDGWETLAAGADFHLDDIDGLLGTTDSPGS
ncbi:hypothetical protein GGS23DRAFT_88967 [Durotheca rogersii]|uniref:uncharacterized protein n=1 Tax=Durotheca rogersii TaxID=419775 RepID=UPI002220802E|nr:uncharacterized protein GGS23DRAFT_88967 [Durotheca rogersii]KAI5862715.1 hypothetical protein GGS23DRAFT_88967 [Durotheca rogersii]